MEYIWQGWKSVDFSESLYLVKRYAWAGDEKETALKKELEVPNASPDHQTTIEGSSFEDVKGLKLTTAFPSVLRLSCWLVALFHMVLNMPRYIHLLSFCVSNSFLVASTSQILKLSKWFIPQKLIQILHIIISMKRVKEGSGCCRRRSRAVCCCGLITNSIWFPN